MIEHDPYADVPPSEEPPWDDAYGHEFAPPLDTAPRLVTTDGEHVESPDDRFSRRVAEEVARQDVAEEAARLRDGRARRRPPELVSLAQLLAEPDVKVPYLIEDLWPAGGRVVLAAQRKAGKTTFRDNLIRSWADGVPFLDRYDVDPRDGVLTVLDFEMSRGQMRTWLRGQGIVARTRVGVWPLRGYAGSFDIRDRRMRTWWAERLRAVKTSVLVLDCLRPVLDGLGMDESRDAGRFLVAFDELLELAGITEAMVIHHAGHSGERSRGDSRLRDWPDAEWRIVRAVPDRPGEEPPPDAPRYFTAEGRDVAVPEAELLYEPRQRRLSLGTGDRASDRKGRSLRASEASIVTLLREAEGPLNARAVRQGARGRPDTIRDALEALVARRLVLVAEGSNRQKLYSLPAAPIPVGVIPDSTLDLGES